MTNEDIQDDFANSLVNKAIKTQEEIWAEVQRTYIGHGFKASEIVDVQVRAAIVGALTYMIADMESDPDPKLAAYRIEDLEELMDAIVYTGKFTNFMIEIGDNE